jgi:hypothetical protein
MGGFMMSAVKGIEHPPIGTFIVEGIVTIIGLFVTRMLLFFVIV